MIGDGTLYNVRHYDLRKLVRTRRSLYYVLGEYWDSDVRVLPNPPILFSDEAELVWYDQGSDIVLLHFPNAVPGTGHNGLYDTSIGADPVLDDHGHTDRCLFVPSGALDFQRMGVSEEDVAAMYVKRGRVGGENPSVRKYSPRAQVCNLSLYGFSQTRVAQIMGVTRQAVHKMLNRLPYGVRERMQPAVGFETQPKCSAEGCEETVDLRSRSRPRRYCQRHMDEFRVKPPAREYEYTYRAPAPKSDPHLILDRLFGQPNEVNNGEVEAQEQRDG